MNESISNGNPIIYAITVMIFNKWTRFLFFIVSIMKEAMILLKFHQEWKMKRKLQRGPIFT